MLSGSFDAVIATVRSGQQAAVTFDSYTIHEGKRLEKTGWVLQVQIDKIPVGFRQLVQTPSGPMWIQSQYREELAIWGQKTGGNAVKFMTEAQILDTQRKLKLMEGHGFKTPSTYRDIKHEQLFRDLYNIRDRALTYERWDGQQSAFVTDTKTEISFPCVSCGVVLPFRCMQVDHQRPKAQDNYEALVKALRSFGFTQAGPKGEKGAILSDLLYGVGQAPTLGVYHAVSPRFGKARAEIGTLEKRYQLNDMGIIIVSIARHRGVIDGAKTNYIHSIYNLRPMCAGCNVGRNSDPQTKF